MHSLQFLSNFPHLLSTTFFSNILSFYLTFQQFSPMFSNILNLTDMGNFAENMVDIQHGGSWFENEGF